MICRQRGSLRRRVRSRAERQIRRRPARVTLAEEHFAPLGLVCLADRCRHPCEPRQCRQEPTIRFVCPTHVSRSTPAIGPKRVQPAVVPDPVVRVCLHGIGRVVTESRPGPAPARAFGHDDPKRGQAILSGEPQREIKGPSCWFRLWGQHSCRGAARGQVHRSGVAHDPRLGDPGGESTLMHTEVIIDANSVGRETCAS